MNINPYIKLFSSAIVKRAAVIKNTDTIEIIKNYEKYRICRLNMETPSLFTYKKEDFINVGLSEDEANMLLLNNSLIQSYLNSDIYSDGVIFNRLMIYMKNKLLNEYVEMNPYVRTLMGLPVYSKYIEIENGTIEGYDLYSIFGDANIYGISDNKKKLYNLTDLEISILKKKDMWNTIINVYTNELWVFYLDRRQDIFKIREAEPYALLHVDMDTFPDLALVFQENYNRVLNYFKNVTFNQFYQEYISNYDASMIVYLLMSALCMTTIDVANENFKLDFSDKDLITAILNSAGLPYIELPQMYLEPFIYNLERMNREKGSKQNIIDIQSIFNLNSIYRYLIYKKPVMDIRDENLTNEEKYDLYFVKVPIDTEDVEPYLANSINHIRYIDMVLDDPYWGSSTDKLYDEIMAQEFNYYETKYISIENMFEFTKNMYDFSTIFKYILNNKAITNQYKIDHARNNFFSFTLFEGFVFIPALILKLKKWNDVIPETRDDVKYVIGIDTNRDFEKYKYTIQMYLSKPEYTKIIDTFRPVENIDDVNEFIDIFCTNKEALRILQQALCDVVEYDSYKILKEIHDLITIVDAVKDIYKDKDGNQITSYVEYLKIWNPDMYNLWLSLETTTELQEELSYIIGLMNDYMNKENDTRVGGELGILNTIGGEYGVSTFQQLKTILKYYKYLTIELKDYSMVFKVDNMLHKNRTFTELHEHQIEHFYKDCYVNEDIINHKEEILKIDTNKTATSIICIDDEGLGNL